MADTAENSHVKISQNKRQELLKLLGAALLIPVIFACTAMTIYFGNVTEIAIDLPSVLRIVSVFFVLTAAVLFMIQLPVLYLWKGKVFPYANVFLLMFGVWLWTEANVFIWDLGVRFDFTEPFPGFRHIERGTLYIGTILSLIFCRRIYRFSLHCSVILIAAQIIALLPVVLNSAKDETTIKPNFSEYEITLNRFFDYSKKGDVYVFVLDLLGTTLFDEISKDIDANELFKDFTYFPKQITFEPVATVWALPRIVGGLDIKEEDMDLESGVFQTRNRKDEHEKFFEDSFSQKTLFDYAIQNGYECQVHSWAPSVLYWNPEEMNNIRGSDNTAVQFNNFSSPQSLLRISRLAGLTLFRFLTYSKKNKYYWRGLLSGRLLLDDELVKSMFAKEYFPLSLEVGDKRFFGKSQNVTWNWTPDQKQLKLMHLEGAHAWNCPDEATDLPLADKAKKSLTDVAVFLEQLKLTGNYDSSLIVIMSDHGVAFSGSQQPIPAGGNKSLLLVKRPGDKHDTMQTNTNPTCVSDTKNAILAELDIPIPDNAFSWFDVPKDIAEKRNAEWTAYLQKIAKKQ